MRPCRKIESSNVLADGGWKVSLLHSRREEEKCAWIYHPLFEAEGARGRGRLGLCAESSVDLLEVDVGVAEKGFETFSR